MEPDAIALWQPYTSARKYAPIGATLFLTLHFSGGITSILIFLHRTVESGETRYSKGREMPYCLCILPTRSLNYTRKATHFWCIWFSIIGRGCNCSMSWWSPQKFSTTEESTRRSVIQRRISGFFLWISSTLDQRLRLHKAQLSIQTTFVYSPIMLQFSLNSHFLPIMKLSFLSEFVLYHLSSLQHKFGICAFVTQQRSKPVISWLHVSRCHV